MTERSRDAVIIPYHIRKEQEDERRLKALEAEVERLGAEVERWKLAHEDIYREYGEKCERVEQLREALSECLEYLEPSFFEEEALVAGVVKRSRAALAGEGGEDA